MFGRKKEKKKWPNSRFCIHATELPFVELYRRRWFTVAISKLSIERVWPIGTRKLYEPSAYGLLRTVSSIEPLLPVTVRFIDDGLPMASMGDAYFDREGSKNGAYVLDVRIQDPDGSIIGTFTSAMQRAINSGSDFMHLHCGRGDNLEIDYSAQTDEEYDFLRRVETGAAKLEKITFDKVSFYDELTTKAAKWTWGAQRSDFSFTSERTAEWREYRKPDLPK